MGIHIERRIMILIAFSLCVIVISACKSQEQGDSCSKDKRQILAIVNELSSYAASTSKNEASGKLTKDVEDKIAEQVRQLKNPDDLAALARICRAFSLHQMDSCVPYGGVYDVAFWDCAKLLAGIKSNEAVRSMKRLYETSDLGEPERGYFKSLMEAQTPDAQHGANDKQQ